MNYEEKNSLTFRGDFEKVYGSISWRFLDYMFIRFSFCEKWIFWKRDYVFVGNRVVLVMVAILDRLISKRD